MGQITLVKPTKSPYKPPHSTREGAVCAWYVYHSDRSGVVLGTPFHCNRFNWRRNFLQKPLIF